MRALFLVTVFLCLAAAPVRAQELAPEDLQRAAKEEMDRIMREGMKPPPAPVPVENNNADAGTAPPAPAASVPPEVPAAPAQEEESPAPCTPEKRDFSHKPPSTAKKYARRQEEIDRMDADCDGLLQAEELQKGVDSRFDAADTDKDGMLSQTESAAIVAQFKADRQQEYGAALGRRARRLENKIKKIDSDEDGKISRGEYTAYYKDRYGKFDENKDGALDVTEFETDVESKPDREHGN